AAELAQQAIDGYLAIGDAARAARTKALLAVAVGSLPGRAAEEVPLIAQARTVESEFTVEIVLRQSQALARAERYDEAMAAAVEAAELAGTNILAAAGAFSMQARLHAGAGWMETAARAADQARTLAQRSEHPV